MKSPRIVQLAIFAMVVFGSVGTAFADSAYTFTRINVPGSPDTCAFGINGSGQIVGEFESPGGSQHGFVDTGGNFTFIDVPGATSSSASGINNSGQIVGGFYDGMNHGFLDTDGSFTTIDMPGAISTSLGGINDIGRTE